MVLYRWELLDLSEVPGDKRESLSKAHDPAIFGVAHQSGKVYQRFGDKVACSAFVWMSANKEKKAPSVPSAKAMSAEGTMRPKQAHEGACGSSQSGRAGAKSLPALENQWY